MAQIDFGGVTEEVITSEEFTVEQARDILSKETIAVVGYGVQGPGQALNMRDNGVNVIVGQRQNSKTWDKAVADGFVPGETLFPIEEAAEKATIVKYLLSDAAQVAMSGPSSRSCLKRRRRPLFLPRFRGRLPGPDRHYPARRRGRDPGGPQRLRHHRTNQFPGRQRHQFQLCHLPGRHRPRQGTHPGRGHRHRLRLSFPHHFRK
jgi:hypothetical protein